MVLWQSELTVSWRSQWVSLLIHGLLALLVLLMPWPIDYTLLWMVLLAIVVFNTVCSQRRIHARRGECKLLDDYSIYWQGHEWTMVGRPWMVDSGMMLKLKRPGKRTAFHLWLSADSMDIEEWRNIRRLLSQWQANRDNSFS